jgi:hypothetical protein
MRNIFIIIGILLIISLLLTLGGCGFKESWNKEGRYVGDQDHFILPRKRSMPYAEYSIGIPIFWANKDDIIKVKVIFRDQVMSSQACLNLTIGPTDTELPFEHKKIPATINLYEMSYRVQKSGFHEVSTLGIPDCYSASGKIYPSYKIEWRKN